MAEKDAGAKRDARSERARRLAEALRANLRRRKAQDRERHSGGEDAAEPQDR